VKNRSRLQARNRVAVPATFSVQRAQPTDFDLMAWRQNVVRLPRLFGMPIRCECSRRKNSHKPVLPTSSLTSVLALRLCSSIWTRISGAGKLQRVSACSRHGFSRDDFYDPQLRLARCRPRARHRRLASPFDNLAMPTSQFMWNWTSPPSTRAVRSAGVASQISTIS